LRISNVTFEIVYHATFKTDPSKVHNPTINLSITMKDLISLMMVLFAFTGLTFGLAIPTELQGDRAQCFGTAGKNITFQKNQIKKINLIPN
jgi:hypothetical protein